MLFLFLAILIYNFSRLCSYLLGLCVCFICSKMYGANVHRNEYRMIRRQANQFNARWPNGFHCIKIEFVLQFNQPTNIAFHTLMNRFRIVSCVICVNVSEHFSLKFVVFSHRLHLQLLLLLYLLHCRFSFGICTWMW